MSDLKPSWWPENPYPEDVFPGSVDDYVAAVPDPKLRTHLSGALGRDFWNVASEMIWGRYREQMDRTVIRVGLTRNGYCSRHCAGFCASDRLNSRGPRCSFGFSTERTKPREGVEMMKPGTECPGPGSFILLPATPLG